MMLSAQKQMKKAIVQYNDDRNSELQNWDEAHAYCAAIQFYLGNYHEEDDERDSFDDVMSELSISDPDNKDRRRTMKLDKGAMKILAYGRAQQLINNRVANASKDRDSASVLDEQTSKRSTVLDDPHDQKNLKIFKECQDSA